jgi:hypothetical protein
MTGFMPLLAGEQWHLASVFRVKGVLCVNYHGIADDCWTGAAFVLASEWDRKSETRNLRMAKSFLEKLVEQHASGNSNAQAADDEDLGNLAPHVFELLTKKVKIDKKTLEPASLLIFARSGSWHACLTHKGLDVRWWAETARYGDLLPALEAAVNKEEGQAASHLNGKHAPRSKPALPQGGG